MGLRVKGSGFRVWGLGFRVEGLGSKVGGLRFRVQGLPRQPGVSVSLQRSAEVSTKSKHPLRVEVSGLGFYVLGFMVNG